MFLLLGFIAEAYVRVIYRLRREESSNNFLERLILEVSDRWHEHYVGMHAPLETEPSIRGFIDDPESFLVHFANETETVVEVVSQCHWVARVGRY